MLYIQVPQRKTANDRALQALFLTLNACSFVSALNGAGRTRTDFEDHEVYKKALLVRQHQEPSTFGIRPISSKTYRGAVSSFGG